MMLLSHIFLHNWHGFCDYLTSVDESSLVAGFSPEDWPVLLDALHLVLLAEWRSDAAQALTVPTLSRVGQSARLSDDSEALTPNPSLRGRGASESPSPAGRRGQGDEGAEANEPDETSYADHDQGGDLLHEHDDTEPDTLATTISYVVLELTDPEQETCVTAGVCIESTRMLSPSCTFFIVPVPLETLSLCSEGHPLDYHGLQRTLRTIPDAHSYCESQGQSERDSYKADLLSWLGGLSPRFFELFAQCAAFSLPTDLRPFVQQWLLEPRPLDADVLRHLTEPYFQLDAATREIEERRTLLQAITSRQAEIVRLREATEQQRALLALLRQEATGRTIASRQRHITSLRQQIAEAGAERERLESAIDADLDTLRELEMQIHDAGSSRHYEAIQREVKQATSEATIIQSRWLALLHDFKREEALLRPLLQQTPADVPATSGGETNHGLMEDEQETLRSLLDGIAALAPTKPPPRPFAALIDAAVQALDRALLRLYEAQFHMLRAVEEERSRGNDVHQKKEQLRQGKPCYPPEVERVCDLLNRTLEKRPLLFCEGLEVTEERWQDAVEAMLADQRFTVLVPPNQLKTAAHTLERLRATERISHTGLLNTGSPRHEHRPAQPGTLAHKVQVHFPVLRPYLDTLLGDIVACEQESDLYNYRRAITPDVVVYRDGMTFTLPPERYRPWYIGRHSQQARIAAYEQELRHVRDQLVRLTRHAKHINAQVARLQRGRTLSNLRQLLDSPLDERPLRAQIAESLARQQSLDRSDVAKQQQQADLLREKIAQHRTERDRLIASTAVAEATLQRLEHEAQDDDRRIIEHEREVREAGARSAHSLEEARTRLRDELPDLEQQEPGALWWERIRTLETSIAQVEARLNQERQQESYDTAVYLTRYPPATPNLSPDEAFYVQTYEHLMETERPYYQEYLGPARQKAVEGLRDDVLLNLRERILMAQRHMERLNDTLFRLELQGCRYRLAWLPNEKLQTFYHLIINSHALDAESETIDDADETGDAGEHRPARSYTSAIDEFLHGLTHPFPSSAHLTHRDDMLDYRSYLSYDIEVIHADGHLSRWLESGGSGAEMLGDGDRAIPLYLIMAASFVRLYRVSERSERSTLRLLPLNETFFVSGGSGRPGSSLEAQETRSSIVLDVLKRLGLQVLIPETI